MTVDLSERGPARERCPPLSTDIRARELARQEPERQRVAHLVLGELRPQRAAGVTRKGKKRASVPRRLAPGVEEAVALRERWSHKQGTPETLDHASRAQQGALARLYRSGAIDANQLAAADEIRSVVQLLRADVNLPSASWETRVDAARCPGRDEEEKLRSVLLQVAYTGWRAAASAGKGGAAMLLDIIVDDWPYTEAARRYGLGDRRAKALLIDALDRWWRCRAERFSGR